jgi:hypothetical protein
MEEEKTRELHHILNISLTMHSVKYDTGMMNKEHVLLLLLLQFYCSKRFVLKAGKLQFRISMR